MNNQVNNKIQKIATIAMLTIVFMASILGTVIFLKHILSPNLSQDQFINKLLSNYQKSIAEPSLAKASHQEKAQIQIRYKLADQTYELNTTSNQSLIFTTKNQRFNQTTLDKKTTNYLRQNNLTVSKTKLTSSNFFNYQTFEDNSIICQSQMNKSETYYAVACVKKDKIKKESTTIKKLLAIYNQKDQLTDVTQITFDQQTKDDVAYAITSFEVSNKRYSLLFGFAGNNWEYLGDLMENNPKYAKDKKSFPANLVAKINQTKYKGFIAEKILGSTS